ncbi:hypothetical protein [Microbacterium sp. A1-JK]|uniref:hypothetical protein n=1 Tax=Microbacterium sp. A1-JK TaxID=3177516 RepID=UPI003884CC3A
MVKSIVIPHDTSRSPRLRHLATASEFQAAVGGWLEPIEMPAPERDRVRQRGSPARTAAAQWRSGVRNELGTG